MLGYAPRCAPKRMVWTSSKVPCLPSLPGAATILPNTRPRVRLHACTYGQSGRQQEPKRHGSISAESPCYAQSLQEIRKKRRTSARQTSLSLSFFSLSRSHIHGTGRCSATGPKKKTTHQSGSLGKMSLHSTFRESSLSPPFTSVRTSFESFSNST